MVIVSLLVLATRCDSSEGSYYYEIGRVPLIVKCNTSPDFCPQTESTYWCSFCGGTTVAGVRKALIHTQTWAKEYNDCILIGGGGRNPVWQCPYRPILDNTSGESCGGCNKR